LMVHGGYAKKYVDENETRFSEHAGMLDFADNVLSRIIVSANTTRVDQDDDEIYLPNDLDDIFDYEYIFHTHPPTPKPGGRATDGILYEFPSIGDIYHFIDHHNQGNIIGSLVCTAEGLYCIRKLTNDGIDINVDEDALYKKYNTVFNKIQRSAVNKYGDRFTTNTFYSKIAQDTEYVGLLNRTMNGFGMHIDYYPRKKDKNGKWYIDTVYLVFRANKPKKHI